MADEVNEGRIKNWSPFYDISFSSIRIALKLINYLKLSGRVKRTLILHLPPLSPTPVDFCCCPVTTTATERGIGICILAN